MLNIVILAAGKGTRMQSQLPKVLHRLAGRPLLGHVLQAASALQPDRLAVVYGFGGDAVPQAFATEPIEWVRQDQQLGTGHAVQQALPALLPGGKTLILLGDVPLLDTELCKQLLQQEAPLALLTFDKAEPTGYGRIVRGSNGQVTGIVEHKDASEAQRAIREINTGIIVADTASLGRWLQALRNDNAQGEYYLTDIVALAVAEGATVVTQKAAAEWQIDGINSKADLARLERVYQLQQAERLLQQGVTLADPARFDLRGSLAAGKDVEIDVGCLFEGEVAIGDGVSIGPYCVIRNSRIAAGTVIAAYTHIDSADVGNDCRLGPFARLRPGTVLQQEAHVGNFVELKNAQVDIGSKINHLSYVGDATVGKQVNIGAGVITCNYDGANKFRTVIGDGAFIGSDSQLVAPVTVGAGATIGAGSTITQEAPAGELTLGRSRQVTITGWKRPVKIKK